MRRLITGGAGFIGVNLAEHYAKLGDSVIIFDNLSRKGASENANWLVSNYPNIEIIRGDIRTDAQLLREIVNENVDIVYHLAAQVAVTMSVQDPRNDFEINALGSFNVLEAVRASKEPPMLFYSSTNKVYGGMEEIPIVDRGEKYDYAHLPKGISEENTLDFHSPYGCSKGTADQYFRDYARIFGIRTVVFRQSCIYGERQFGIEDQGWLAWFTIAAFLGKPITIFGDGKQVRDVLHVKDLINAFDMASRRIEITSGRISNIGGGAAFTLSLLELLEHLKTMLNKNVSVNYSTWRAGDQKVFISDCTRAEQEFGWRPIVSPKEGTSKLLKWVEENEDTVKRMFS